MTSSRTERGGCRQALVVAAWFALHALACTVAERAYAHGALHEQIARVSRQLQHSPDDAQLYLQRATLRHAHAEFAGAGDDFDRAAALAPQHAEIDLHRGRMLLDARDPAAARRALDRFVQRMPASGEGRLERARAARALGDVAGATADFDAAIGLLAEPGPDPYLERAELLLAARPLPAAQAREALIGIEAGLARLGPLVALELKALEAELALKDHDAALARLDRLAATASRKETWHLRRGDVLRAAGRDNEAQDAYRSGRAAVNGLPEHLRHLPATLDIRQQLALRLGAPKPAASRQASRGGQGNSGADLRFLEGAAADPMASKEERR